MPDLERVQQNTPLTLSQQWYESGAVVDPGTVTLGITRADGTSLVAAGTATSGSGTGTRTFNLTTTHTALLDTLKVTWTSTLKGTLVSYVEVAGGFLFSIADMRALEPLNNTTKYPTASLVATRTMAEQALEDACGVAFVPRYRLESIRSADLRGVVVDYPRVTAIRTVTVDGTVWTSDQIATLNFGTTGLVVGLSGSLTDTSRSTSWYTPTRAITIGYEHGYTSTPARVSRAALLLARSWLMSGPIDDRASTFTSGDGGVYSLVTPGRGGSIFGIPEVDATVQQYGMVVGVA